MFFGQESQEALPCTSPASSASREEQEVPTSTLGAAPVRGWRGAQAPPWRAGPCKLHPVSPQAEAKGVCFLSCIPRCSLGSFWSSSVG